MNPTHIELNHTDPFPDLFPSPAPLPMGGGGPATSPSTCSEDASISYACASAPAWPAHGHALTREAPEMFRWRVIGRCPCCLTAWVIDIDAADDPIASWDWRRMSDALLCGSCQARKRVLYVAPDGRRISLWTSRDVSEMLSHLQDPGVDCRAYISKKRPLVVDGPERQPIDQVEEVLSRFRRLSVIGDGFLRAAGVDWSRYIRYALAPSATKMSA